MAAEHKHMKFDRVGLVLSGICLIHCLGTPFLILLFPMLYGLDGWHHSLHWVAALLLIPLALWAVTQGYAHHRKRVVPLLAGLGATLIAVGASLPYFSPESLHGSHQHWFSDDIVLSVIGSFCLLGCHTLNIYYCRKSGRSKPHCDSCH